MTTSSSANTKGCQSTLHVHVGAHDDCSECAINMQHIQARPFRSTTQNISLSYTTIEITRFCGNPNRTHT